MWMEKCIDGFYFNGKIYIMLSAEVNKQHNHNIMRRGLRN